MHAILPLDSGFPTVRAAEPPELKAVCDLELLVDRCMGDDSLAADLLGRFSERLPKTVAEIERLAAETRWADGLKCIHSLKGEAGSLAAARVQQAAIELETCMRSTRVDDVAGRVGALAAASEQFQQALPRLVLFLSGIGAK
jgi:HPt (histidine-containing phosphotransfer) domain-containing protein